jgi:hypothetical protein
LTNIRLPAFLLPLLAGGRPVGSVNHEIVKRASIVGIAVTSLVLAQAAPAQPKVQNSDSAEEIAKDAARDLKDNRFYNKPGATRAQYDADWQECRLIARGSQLPRGSSSYYNPMLYNPSISPLAAGLVAGSVRQLLAPLRKARRGAKIASAAC